MKANMKLDEDEERPTKKTKVGEGSEMAEDLFGMLPDFLVVEICHFFFSPSYFCFIDELYEAYTDLTAFTCACKRFNRLLCAQRSRWSTAKEANDPQYDLARYFWDQIEFPMYISMDKVQARLMRNIALPLEFCRVASLEMQDWHDMDLELDYLATRCPDLRILYLNLMTIPLDLGDISPLSPVLDPVFERFRALEQIYIELISNSVRWNISSSLVIPQSVRVFRIRAMTYGRGLHRVGGWHDVDLHRVILPRHLETYAQDTGLANCEVVGVLHGMNWRNWTGVRSLRCDSVNASEFEGIGEEWWAMEKLMIRITNLDDKAIGTLANLVAHMPNLKKLDIRAFYGLSTNAANATRVVEAIPQSARSMMYRLNLHHTQIDLGAVVVLAEEKVFPALKSLAIYSDDESDIDVMRAAVLKLMYPTSRKIRTLILNIKEIRAIAENPHPWYYLKGQQSPATLILNF